MNRLMTSIYHEVPFMSLHSIGNLISKKSIMIKGRQWPLWDPEGLSLGTAGYGGSRQGTTHLLLGFSVDSMTYTVTNSELLATGAPFLPTDTQRRESQPVLAFLHNFAGASCPWGSCLEGHLDSASSDFETNFWMSHKSWISLKLMHGTAGGIQHIY